jgi:hypothetical protein
MSTSMSSDPIIADTIYSRHHAHALELGRQVAINLAIRTARY